MFLRMNLLTKNSIKITKNMNCILTPHTAGVTEESNTRVSNFIVDTTNKFFQSLKD